MEDKKIYRKEKKQKNDERLVIGGRVDTVLNFDFC